VPGKVRLFMEISGRHWMFVGKMWPCIVINFVFLPSSCKEKRSGVKSNSLGLGE